MSSREPNSKTHKFSEVAGGATADCAALCCCPFAVFGLVSLAIVKVPAGLCRKAVRRIARNSGKAEKIKEGTIIERKAAKSVDRKEDKSAEKSSDSALSVIESRNSLSARTTSLSNEEFWEAVSGKSYVGFWRNHSIKDEN